MPRKILIDTDPGVDDSMAIVYALSCPEFEVVGLTSIFGNHNIDVCTTNALKLLEIVGRSDIPVARGAARPLAMEYLGPSDFVHGADGQGNVFLSPPTTTVASTAPPFIVDMVMSHPGEITLVPIGPLTNIALAFLLEPRVVENVAGIVLMGGAAFVGGNSTAAAEANIYNDPEAADLVLGANCPIVMIPLDVTEKTNVTKEQLARYGESSKVGAKYLSTIIPFYWKFHMNTVGLDGIHLHDSSTISYMLRPDLYQTVSHPVRVDCGDGVGRGNTICAERPPRAGSKWYGRPNITIAVGVDDQAVIEMELGRVC
jgi:inosine-uridine nucleoside N-ribohydrolase